MLAVRDKRESDSQVHLEEARSLARFVGEQNHMFYHFGPTNVESWALTIGVESGNGPDAAETFVAAGHDLAVLDSKDRESSIQFDLARAWSQAGGPRDREATVALDMADRLAPLRTRNDPLALEVAEELDGRNRATSWELGSLKRRLGVH